ncbi:MAG: TetR/AcrR family transcriptional regulator [Endozoicomonas sp.]
MIELKKATRSELKRQAILTAARQAFQEYGVQGTSMDTLAAMAQVSKRTVYNHFATKDALVLHLMTEMWQEALQEIDVVYNPDQPLSPQLLALVRAEMDVACRPEYIDLMRVAFGYYFYNADALQKEISRLTQQETAMIRWLKAAMDDKRLKPLDLELASTQLHSLYKGSSFWPQMLKLAPVPDEAQRQHIAEQAVAMFLSYYQSDKG